MAPPEPPEPLDVVFAEATPHQRVLSWTLNGASWAPPLTLEQYIGRETALSNTPLSINGGTRYYILHPRNDPETIISACEVTAKQAILARPPSPQQGTRGALTREVPAYAIASVFTNPRFRQRGMASLLLRKVQEVVDRGGAEYGALYSDIGREYYTRLGWKDFGSPQVVISFEPEVLEHIASPPEGTAFLKEEDVISLCKFDVSAVRRRFDGIAAARNDDGKTHIAFLPTPEQFGWHFARDKYMCKTLLGRDVVHRGARTEGGDSWLSWDHDLREKKLKILRIVLSLEGPERAEYRKAVIARLLMAAMAEATDWGLHKVLVWEPSAEVAEAVTELGRYFGPGVDVVFDEREDGSIPSLRWKGGEGLEGVVWENNEYYAWC